MIEFLKEKSEIEAWLQTHGIENYTLRPDPEYGYKVDIAGDLSIQSQNIRYLPVKFGDVKGACYFNECFLLSLQGSPDTVSESFACSNNALFSLKGAPHTVDGNFICTFNSITDLQGCPREIGEGLYVYNNQLTSLEGAPKTIGYELDICNNPLTSLKGLDTEFLTKGNIFFNNTAIPELEQFKDAYTGRHEDIITTEEFMILREKLKLSTSIQDKEPSFHWSSEKSKPNKI